MQSHQQESSFSWTNQLTEGFLQKPTDKMMAEMIKLESIFKELNKDAIVYSRHYIKNFISVSNHIPLDIKVKQIFFRSRMYFRIKQLNTVQEENSRKRKKKINKTIL